mgnify:CR=1 FL=1
MLNNFRISSALAKTVIISLVFMLTACSKPDEKNASNTSIETAQPSSTNQKTAVGAPSANQGIVRNVTQAGGYSYIETDINGSLFWIATAITAVKPEDKISWNDYAIMSNFKSKALNKTFDQILFVDRIQSASLKPASGGTQGTVIEAMSAAGYTYIQVKEGDNNIWLAAPQTTLNNGDIISWSGGAPMQNFTSKSLGKTFDTIYFVGAVNQIKG